MKITKIVAKGFHQFKNLEIDLTYPKGHAKEGEPLDKVCFIGQSGTGKTTLLKIIGGYTYTIKNLFTEYNHEDFKKVKIGRKISDLETDMYVKFDPKTKKSSYTWDYGTYKIKGKNVSFEEAVKYSKAEIDKIKTQFVYFPADLKYEYETASSFNLNDKKVVDFRNEKIGDVWNLVFKEIERFQEEQIRLNEQIASEIKAILSEGKDTVKRITASARKLDQHKKSLQNPIVRLADECLDQVLQHINLRVKREFKFESKLDIGIVKLEDLNGNEVPYSLLSTGTKQILLTVLPLYLLKPKDTLILIDEPERSLYPSMQKFIIDYYLSFTKNSQVFFATHSPIIASNFEPWEIVELKFDEKGFVYQELYYPKGKERHVDNYKIVPSYLTYDLMLSKVFDLTETHSHERSEKITEVLMLRNQLQTLKEQGKGKSKEWKALYEGYSQLAGKLFWDFDIAD